MKKHGAVMDCRTSILSIGEKSRYHVPMFMAQQQTKCDSVAVTAPVDMEIPGRTIRLIQGELQREYDSVCEALVEPASIAPPTEFVHCTDSYPSSVPEGGHSTGNEC